MIKGTNVGTYDELRQAIEAGEMVACIGFDRQGQPALFALEEAEVEERPSPELNVPATMIESLHTMAALKYKASNHMVIDLNGRLTLIWR